MRDNEQTLNSIESRKVEQQIRPESNEQVVIEKEQYEYLKQLNKKLTLFKKPIQTDGKSK